MIKHTQQDFWDRVQMHPNGCWHWTGFTTPRGYGRATGRPFGLPAKQAAHRLMWAIVRNGGNAPEPGINIHHTCHNKRCCNPHHLEALTEKEHAALHGKTWLDGCPHHGFEHWKYSRCLLCYRLKRRKSGSLLFHGPTTKTHLPDAPLRALTGISPGSMAANRSDG